MNLRVRPARGDARDYAAWLGFWNELGLGGHTPPVFERYAEHIAPSTLYLEAPGGRLAAYGLSFPFGDRGDVRQIVVGSAFRGQGIGRQIMAAVRARLVAAGCTNWRLEVKSDNAAAIALYEAVGMTTVRTIDTLHMTGDDAARFAATRSGRHAAVPIAPTDDATLEANLDLGAGQIQRWRTFRAHCPLVRVGTTAMAQIWRDFEPELWLMFPFLAPDPDVAATLLAEALPIPHRVELPVTNARVREALHAAGATLFQEQLEMGGPL